MCLYLKHHKIDTKAIVASIGLKSVTLIIPDFEIEKVTNYMNNINKLFWKSINFIKIRY